MRCPYEGCRERRKNDTCELRAEQCETYHIHRRNGEQIAEVEARFGKMDKSIKKIYRSSFEEFPV